MSDVSITIALFVAVMATLTEMIVWRMQNAYRSSTMADAKLLTCNIISFSILLFVHWKQKITTINRGWYYDTIQSYSKEIPTLSLTFYWPFADSLDILAQFGTSKNLE